MRAGVGGRAGGACRMDKLARLTAWQIGQSERSLEGAGVGQDRCVLVRQKLAATLLAHDRWPAASEWECVCAKTNPSCIAQASSARKPGLEQRRKKRMGSPGLAATIR